MVKFEPIIALLAMAMMLRISYELSGPKPKSLGQMSLLYERQPHPVSDRISFILKQREWANKAIKGYAQSQDKKWRNWTDAMFEPN